MPIADAGRERRKGKAAVGEEAAAESEDTRARRRFFSQKEWGRRAAEDATGSRRAGRRREIEPAAVARAHTPRPNRWPATATRLRLFTLIVL